ncbi:alpha/beta fold hydrolase [Tropicimonas sp. IMCC34011]|uniref:alpha/beta fold hydrolase n=1 Tax=Tropicimonas sp. IMCC34011 TaxID=2248759 RepID=UPI000E27A53D|nr:alpha/beta hydrolase [Tropicimonas sp. IMCC34011]
MRRFVDTRMGQVCCHEEGQGAPLLMIHQSGQSARMFFEALPLLGRTRRAIAIDLPGFGLSDSMPEGASMADLADLCVDVLDALGIARADVYGHHSGNKIATELSVRAPDRVKRLVLAGQSHSIIADRDARNAAIAKFTSPHTALAAIDDPVAAAAEKWMRTLSTVSSAWTQPGAASSDEVRRHARRQALDAIDGAEGSARLYAANTAYDLGQGYTRIPVETLLIEIVTDEEDEMIGRQGAPVCALIPNARLAEISAPNGDGVTLEWQAQDLVGCLEEFLGEPDDNT